MDLRVIQKIKTKRTNINFITQTDLWVFWVVASSMFSLYTLWSVAVVKKITLICFKETYITYYLPNTSYRNLKQSMLPIFKLEASIRLRSNLHFEKPKYNVTCT